jgi:hypothetical protein
MCKIIILEPGFTLPYELLENAVYNNPDGYGLILKDPKYKKLQIIRSKTVDGKMPENDPKSIYDLLRENDDCQRFLHVRHRTEGPIDDDNTHPFVSFFSDKRQVYFMHNGTLYDYKPKSGQTTWVNNVRVESKGDGEISDSKKFNDDVLFPFLNKFTGDQGKGDIHDPLFEMYVKKFWGVGGENRGLLISNDQDYKLISSDKWKTISVDSGKFLASNDSYFKDVIRGPEFERRKAAKAKEEAANPRPKFQQGNTNTWPITPIKDIDLAKTVSLKNNLQDFFNLGVDCWDEESLVALSNVTEPEFIDLANKHPEEMASMMVILTSYYKDVFERYTRAANHLRDLNAKGKTDMTVEDLRKAA